MILFEAAPVIVVIVIDSHKSLLRTSGSYLREITVPTGAVFWNIEYHNI